MLLIRQQFRCVLQLFYGQSSEVRKEESKHMSYMVPAFYTVTTASKHDSTAMSSIPYEPNS